SKVLYDLWNIVSTHYSARYGSYDAGTMEAMIPAFKYKGKGFETRHRFYGNLLSGEVTLRKQAEGKKAELRPNYSVGTGPDQWFARKGNSAYFTNDKDVVWPLMFIPLYEAFDIHGNARDEFDAYISNLIEAEFRYLVNRLKAANIAIDT